MNGVLKNLSGWSKILILCGLVVIIAVIIVLVVLRSWEKEPIKIGAVLSLSGPGAATTVDVRNGMQLAIDEVNAWGGINGRRVELIIEDSQTNAGEGVKAFERIEAAHQCLLYVSNMSSVSLSLAPLAETREVVLLGLVVSAPGFTEGKEWVFRYWNTAAAEIPVVMSVVEDLEIKKLGMIFLDDPFGRSFYELLKQELEQVGGTISGEGFESRQTDFQLQIEALMGMEGIHVVGYVSHIKNILEQLNELGYGGYILGSNAVARKQIRSMPEADGAYVVASIIHKADFVFARDTKQKYESEYGTPFTPHAGGGYDLVAIFAGLLENKEVTRDAVRRALDDGFVYSGVFGSINVSAGEHDMSYPLYPARIVDGELDYLR